MNYEITQEDIDEELNERAIKARQSAVNVLKGMSNEELQKLSDKIAAAKASK